MSGLRDSLFADVMNWYSKLIHVYDHLSEPITSSEKMANIQLSHASTQQTVVFTE